MVGSCKNRMDVTKVEVKYPPQKPNFNEVKVDSYLENIHNVSIADSAFSADLYIWFSLLSNKDLNPGETFQVIGGKMDSKELSSEHYLNDGGALNYVVDDNSAISSRVKIPGYRVANFQNVVKPHDYKSTSTGASISKYFFHTYCQLLWV